LKTGKTGAEGKCAAFGTIIKTLVITLTGTEFAPKCLQFIGKISNLT
jgi:hypothetical protein